MKGNFLCFEPLVAALPPKTLVSDHHLGRGTGEQISEQISGGSSRAARIKPAGQLLSHD
jgi:hypothetical protein